MAAGIVGLGVVIVGLDVVVVGLGVGLGKKWNTFIVQDSRR